MSRISGTGGVSCRWLKSFKCLSGTSPTLVATPRWSILELHPVLPDAEEEHASVARINKWVSLADAALGTESVPKRKHG